MNATANPQSLVVPTEQHSDLIAAQRQAANATAEASAMVIDSQAMYQLASDEVNDLRARWKAIEAQRVHLKEPFLEGCKRIDALFKIPLDALEQAASGLKSRMVVFQQDEEAKARKARDEQAARERAAREAAEAAQREAAERERAARAEADRVAREASERAAREAAEAAAAEAAARAAGDEAAAEAARAAGAAAADAARVEAEAAQAAAEVVALEATNAAAAAQADLELATIEPSVPAPVSRAVAAGSSVRKVWKAHLESKADLVRACAERLATGDDSLLAFLSVDEPALNRFAGAMKAQARVPGVAFREEASITATGRGR